MSVVEDAGKDFLWAMAAAIVVDRLSKARTAAASANPARHRVGAVPQGGPVRRQPRFVPREPWDEDPLRQFRLPRLAEIMSAKDPAWLKP